MDYEKMSVGPDLECDGRVEEMIAATSLRGEPWDRGGVILATGNRLVISLLGGATRLFFYDELDSVRFVPLTADSGEIHLSIHGYIQTHAGHEGVFDDRTPDTLWCGYKLVGDGCQAFADYVKSKAERARAGRRTAAENTPLEQPLCSVNLV
jgi:hypothetical protein